MCISDKEHIQVLNNQEATRQGILDSLDWLKEKAIAFIKMQMQTLSKTYSLSAFPAKPLLSHLTYHTD